MYKKILIFITVIFITKIFGGEVPTLCESDISEPRCVCNERSMYTLPMIHADCSLTNLMTAELNIRLPSLIGILDLSRNKIEYLRDNAFLTSVILFDLNLSSNRISYIKRTFFRNLPKLRRLDLSRNKLSELPDDIFYGLNRLEFLNLRNNRIQTLAENMFLDQTQLNELWLSENHLGYYLSQPEISLINTLKIASNLKILHIENIDLKNCSDVLLQDIQLSSLYMNDNPLEKFPNVPNTVEILDVSGMKFSQISLADLNLPNLKQLYMNRLDQLTTIENYAFINLDEIEILSIEGCKSLRSFNSMAFGLRRLSNDSEIINNHTLEKFSLARNSLTYLNKSLIHLLKRIRVVNLEGNPWVCSCRIKWFQELSIDFTSPYLRCVSLDFKNQMVQNITDDLCVKEKRHHYYAWMTATLLALVLLLLFFAFILVYLGPYNEKQKLESNIPKLEGQIGPNSPYRRITIEPNDAEDELFKI